jgi:hypothetical protein
LDDLEVKPACTADQKSMTNQVAAQLQFPGTTNSRYVVHERQANLTGGYYITGDLTKVWKKLPARTHKSMLLESFIKPNTKLIPLLKLKVGLEFSLCSGNARRITLWEAIRLSYVLQLTPNTSHAERCTHELGSKECIMSCWQVMERSTGIDSLDVPESSNTSHPNAPGMTCISNLQARRIIIDRIADLAVTGVDPDNSLQAWRPFGTSAYTLRVLIQSKAHFHHWIPVLVDSRDTSTFAVVTKRCLEFHSRVYNSACQQSCSAAKGTVLSTRIMLDTGNLPRHDNHPNRPALAMASQSRKPDPTPVISVVAPSTIISEDGKTQLQMGALLFGHSRPPLFTEEHISSFQASYHCKINLEKFLSRGHRYC